MGESPDRLVSRVELLRELDAVFVSWVRLVVFGYDSPPLVLGKLREGVLTVAGKGFVH